MVSILKNVRQALRKSILTKSDRNLATFPLNSQQRLFYHAYLSNRQFPKEFHKSRSIFLHTPKCAGSSIIKSFYNNTNIGHYPAIWYEGAYPKEFDNYFKFSFVRNPFDRIVSAYHYLSQSKTSRNKPITKFVNNFNSFDEFILEWLCEENIKKIVVTSPQYLYLEDQFGSIRHMNYIGRMESLEKDIKFITNKLGFDSRLMKINQSKRKDFRSYYNNELVDHVSLVYERDIKLFGYTFE